MAHFQNVDLRQQGTTEATVSPGASSAVEGPTQEPSARGLQQIVAAVAGVASLSVPPEGSFLDRPASGVTDLGSREAEEKRNREIQELLQLPVPPLPPNVSRQDVIFEASQGGSRVQSLAEAARRLESRRALATS